MRMISALLGLTGFFAICVLSFNYVEGHESTKVKKELEESKQEIERIVGDAKVLNQSKIDVEGRLKQACSLLAALDILDGGICDGEELEEGEKPDVVESGPDKFEKQKCEVCGTEWSAAKGWPCPKCHDREASKSEGSFDETD